MTDDPRWQDWDYEPTRYGGQRRVPTGDSSTAEQPSDERPTGVRHLRPGPARLGLEWRRPLGLPDCPYVYRWKAGPFRVHHWVAPDDDRAAHDHPWWFLTFVVKGGYDDVIPTRHVGPDTWWFTEPLEAPTWRFRQAGHRHYVRPHEGGAWTFMITGRRRRRWGFYPGGKFVKANKWFASRGHHPCAADNAQEET